MLGFQLFWYENLTAYAFFVLLSTLIFASAWWFGVWWVVCCACVFFLIYFLLSLKVVQSVTKLVKVTGGSYRCSASLCATIISTCPSSALLFERVLVNWLMKIQYFLDWLLLCVKLWLTPSNHVQLGCTLQLVNFRKLCHTECSDVKLTLLPLQKCGWYRGK